MLRVPFFGEVTEPTMLFHWTHSIPKYLTGMKKPGNKGSIIIIYTNN